MTLEKSHGRLYSLRSRSRDLAPVDPPAIRPAERDERGRWTGANRAAVARASKTALSAPLRRAVAQGVAAGLGDAASPQTGTETAREALALFRQACKELGCDSTLVRSHVMRWAVATTVGSALTTAAMAAGMDSDRGLRLLERAERHAQLAERSSITAVDVMRALRGSSPEDPHAAAREAFGKPPT